MKQKILIAVRGPAVVVLCTALGLVLGSFTAREPKHVDLTIYARKYAFEPPTIKINRGDTVSINLITRDVTHGFYLEGHDIDAKVRPQHAPEYSTLLLRHPSKDEEFKEVDRIVFTANKTGKFRYRCSVTCGYMHPFMQGELVVSPNYPFWGGMGFCAGIALAMALTFVTGTRKVSAEAQCRKRPDAGSNEPDNRRIAQ